MSPREEDWRSDVEKKLTFYVVLLCFFLVHVFNFWNKAKHFFLKKSVSPEANLELRPTDICQFLQFPQDPVPSQDVQPVEMAWNTG